MEPLTIPAVKAEMSPTALSGSPTPPAGSVIDPASGFLVVDKFEDLLPESPLVEESPMSASFPHSVSATPTPGGMRPLPNAPPRRPTRKSTLTQQQKNQKRQRATQDQLNTLEVEFNKNPTPTAGVRDRIADEINMTERSVQIWFQNRRAKIKNMAKRSLETGEECDAIPESMRKYLAIQALESGKPLLQMDGLRGIGGMPSSLLMNADSNANKVPISHLTCRSLSIGTWRRVGQSQLDLVVFYSPTKSVVTYYIQAEGSGFRIEYPFSSIKSITLDHGDTSANADGAVHQHQQQWTGGLIVELCRPPIFTMDQGPGGWFQCRDFTEDRQASQVLVHYLGGHPKVLSGQLTKLCALEVFKNRQMGLMQDTIAMPIPIHHAGMAVANIAQGGAAGGPPRPSSQPNNVHEQNMIAHNAAIKQDVGLNAGMGPPPPRGHKRQRSRSVPAALDFTQRRQPMTPFTLHQHQHHHIHLSSPVPGAVPGPPMQQPQSHIFAPIPQYAPSHLPQHHHPAVAGAAGQVGTPVNHDAGSECPCGFCPPPTASTTASPPSEFDGTPISGAQYFDPAGGATVTTPFTNPFAPSLVDASSLINSSVSPLSTMSHHESMMHGPDKTHPHQPWLGRSASADITILSPNQDDTEAAKWLQFVQESNAGAFQGFDYRQMSLVPELNFGNQPTFFGKMPQQPPQQIMLPQQQPMQGFKAVKTADHPSTPPATQGAAMRPSKSSASSVTTPTGTAPMAGTPVQRVKVEEARQQQQQQPTYSDVHKFNEIKFDPASAALGDDVLNFAAFPVDGQQPQFFVPQQQLNLAFRAPLPASPADDRTGVPEVMTTMAPEAPKVEPATTSAEEEFAFHHMINLSSFDDDDDNNNNGSSLSFSPKPSEPDEVSGGQNDGGILA